MFSTNFTQTLNFFAIQDGVDGDILQVCQQSEKLDGICGNIGSFSSSKDS